MKCPKAKLCGGCPLLSIPYQNQGEQKRQKVMEQLAGAHLRMTVSPVHLAESASRYRNKVIVGFARTPDKKVYAGLYAPKSHKVIAMKDCMMQPKLVNEIIQEITHLIESMKIQLYNPKTRTGLLRHVLIRYAESTNQAMVVFVTARKEFPSRRNLVHALTERFPQIVTIAQNINPRDTSIVLQDETLLLYGKGMITDDLCGLKISYSPSAFYQIHHDQCEVLYNLGKDMLNLSDKDKVLDTYCGVGTIGLFLSRFCKEVTGVEINRDAVQNAMFNARQNEIKNIRFVAMDSTRYMAEARKNHQFYNAIVLDPPRAGTTPSFIENACALHPDKILYISCDPTTQIRDLKLFKRFGYTSDHMELVDMFPNTEHIESLVLLTPSKQTPKAYNKTYNPAQKGPKARGAYNKGPKNHSFSKSKGRR